MNNLISNSYHSNTILKYLTSQSYNDHYWCGAAFSAAGAGAGAGASGWRLA